MKLTLLFLAMDVLTLLAYPVAYLYRIFQRRTRPFKSHTTQSKTWRLLRIQEKF